MLNEEDLESSITQSFQMQDSGSELRVMGYGLKKIAHLPQEDKLFLLTYFKGALYLQDFVSFFLRGIIGPLAAVSGPSSNQEANTAINGSRSPAGITFRWLSIERDTCTEYDDCYCELFHVLDFESVVLFELLFHDLLGVQYLAVND